MNAASESPPETVVDSELRLAAEVLYRLFAALFSHPDSASLALLRDPGQQRLAVLAADRLREHWGATEIEFGFGEEPQRDLDLRPLFADLRNHDFRLSDEVVRVFGLTPGRECAPYETDYQANEDPFFRSQEMADAAGFYRAFGVQPGGPDGRERPDHVALELEFMALLLTKERMASSGASHTADDHREICRQAQTAFLRDHLAWWTPAFAQAVHRKAAHGPLALAAQALAAFVPCERTRLGVPPFYSPVDARPAEPESTECAGCALAQLS